jgi:hypothetical protein
VENVYEPKKGFLENKDGRLSVDDVKWITVLRHPYSRTLSHYQHVRRASKEYQNLTLEEFLVERGRGGFAEFIDNQQTRWHCGTGECVNTKIRTSVTRDMLEHAIHNLNKMSAVLILEEMAMPQSCTRRQMRHVLNFTKLESFSDEGAEKFDVKADNRNSETNWEGGIRPHLDNAGRPKNHTLVSHLYSKNSSAAVMSALGLHNDMDLQLYGYARHLCEALADKYDEEARASMLVIPVNKTANLNNNVTASVLFWINATDRVRQQVNITRVPSAAYSRDFLDVEDLSQLFTFHTFVVILLLAVCRQSMCRFRKGGGSV